VADLDDLSRIEALKENRGFLALRERVHEETDGYLKSLAFKMLHSQDPLDQRVIDYKRGFFRGMAWIMALPDTPKFREELEKALNERTASE